VWPDRAGIEQAGGVEFALGCGEGRAEKRRALALISRHVITADGLVTIALALKANAVNN
jgi:hypothetical protein